MYKCVKRILMIILMMLFLCFLFFGIKFYVVDNVDKSSLSFIINVSDIIIIKIEDILVYEINIGNISVNSISI